MLSEFKTFINKGNVMELAVGLIMATYFGAIVKSLVNDIIMPPIGKLLGGVDFAKLKYVIQDQVPAVMDGETVVTPEVAEVAINYGAFFNTILIFLIVSFCVFMVVKSYNRMKDRLERKVEEVPAEVPEPSKEEILLTEIRDALRNK